MLAALLLGSCRGDEGPMGPEGPAGPAGLDGRDGQDGQDGLFATACFDKTMNAVILKVANVSNDDQSIRLNWTGKAKDIKAGYKEVEMITLSSYQMDAENSLDDPLKIAPKTEILSNDVNVLSVPAKAFQVYVFKK